MGEIVRLKSGITQAVERTSKRTEKCVHDSGLSTIPSLKSGLSLVVRLISAVRTEETEA